MGARSRHPGGVNASLCDGSTRFVTNNINLATWVALNDPFGFGIPQYSEKHPFSEILLRYWNGFMFPFAKVLLVLIVVWVLDRDIKQETTDEANMARGRRPVGSRTHCPADHAFAEWGFVDEKGRQRCRLCRREQIREAMRRRRAA